MLVSLDFEPIKDFNKNNITERVLNVSVKVLQNERCVRTIYTKRTTNACWFYGCNLIA